jgi:hypothetical protein
MGVNYHGQVKALHVADAGIEGVKKQDVIPWVSVTAWTGNWNGLLQTLGALCAGASPGQVSFNSVPADGAAWVRTGTPTLFIRDNVGAPGENADECDDRDGIIMIRADGRLAVPGAIMAVNKPVALDLTVTGSGGGWDNAVNGGTGTGSLINGNAMVFGGVSLVQTGGGLVWAMGGGSGVRNNYLPAQVSEQLSAGTRALLNPTLLALGDIALNASFRVEQGTVSFSGGATVGLPQGSVTTRKETMDMALANDFDPGAIPEIHADVERQPNPPATSSFPLLAHVVGAGDTRTWEAMMNQDGLHITQAELGSNVMDAALPGAIPIAGGLREFCRRSLNYAGAAPASCVVGPNTPVPGIFNLTINPSTESATLVAKGIIVFDNFPSGIGLQIGKPTTSDKLSVITYSGDAVIFVDDASPANCITPGTACAGHVTVGADLKTANGAYPTAVNPPTYPAAADTVNNIALVAERIGLARGADDSSLSGAAQLTMTGLFYAQTQVYSCKQNEIFGSLFSRTVGMSCNVPKIASVKTMNWFLPPGLIGSTPPGPGTLAVLRWREGTQ